MTYLRPRLVCFMLYRHNKTYKTYLCSYMGPKTALKSYLGPYLSKKKLKKIKVCFMFRTHIVLNHSCLEFITSYVYIYGMINDVFVKFIITFQFKSKLFIPRRNTRALCLHLKEMCFVDKICFVCFFVCFFVWGFFTHIETSSLPLTGCKF